MARRRRRVDPGKAAAAAMGGFYDRIIVTQAGWSSCSSCGNKTALVDRNGECLRCLLERRKAAREASA